MSTVKASLLFYRIPEASRFPNPSPALRRRAVRLDGSVWAVPTHLIPHALCNEMTERGVTWYTVQFDDSESANLTRIAHEHLQAEIKAAVARAQKSLQRAQDEYENPAAEKGPMTVGAFTDRVDKAVKRAKELLGDLTEAARVFDLDPDTMPIQWAAAQAELIGQAARNRAKIYAGAGVRAAAIGVEGQAIANAVRADDIPANVVADYLLDHGDEDGYDSLTTAFSEEPVAAPAPAVEDADELDDCEKLPWE